MPRGRWSCPGSDAGDGMLEHHLTMAQLVDLLWRISPDELTYGSADGTVC